MKKPITILQFTILLSFIFILSPPLSLAAKRLDGKTVQATSSVSPKYPARITSVNCPISVGSSVIIRGHDFGRNGQVDIALSTGTYPCKISVWRDGLVRCVIPTSMSDAIGRSSKNAVIRVKPARIEPPNSETMRHPGGSTPYYYSGEEGPGVKCEIQPSNKVDFEDIRRQLNRHARDLRAVGEAIRVHARTRMPRGLDSEQRVRFNAKRRELKATAAAVQKLIKQIEIIEKKARRRTFTRADMVGLGEEDDPLAGRRFDASGLGLDGQIREVEAMQESVRNERQMASTAFQNFDQKANQLYNLLSSVMKAMNEMRMGTVRNML